MSSCVGRGLEHGADEIILIPKVWPHHKFHCSKEGLDVYTVPLIKEWEFKYTLDLVLKDIFDLSEPKSLISTFCLVTRSKCYSVL